MGQYYRQLVGNKDGEILAVYNCCSLLPNGKKDFDGFKLMEHSWIDNWFVNGICKQMIGLLQPLLLMGWGLGDSGEAVRGEVKRVL